MNSPFKVTYGLWIQGKMMTETQIDENGQITVRGINKEYRGQLGDEVISELKTLAGCLIYNNWPTMVQRFHAESFVADPSVEKLTLDLGGEIWSIEVQKPTDRNLTVPASFEVLARHIARLTQSVILSEAQND